jgi:predicted CXXCH cytochrome family protein
MADYHLETGIFDKYAASVHGIALLEEEDIGAPACNDCHGNHGALPPEVTSLAEVCGTCHPNNQKLFAESPIAQPFREAGLEACIECHDHHAIEKPTDDMVGVGEESVCMNCHAESDPAYNVARVMHGALTSLVSLSDSAATMEAHVARIGMDEVDIEFLLKDAHQSLIQARTLVHSFDASRLTEETDEGLAKAREAIDLASQQIEEHRNRRLGFAVAAFFATLLLIALYLKLRDIERVSPTSGNQPNS